jgi:hypothetical protein
MCWFDFPVRQFTWQIIKHTAQPLLPTRSSVFQIKDVRVRRTHQSRGRGCRRLELEKGSIQVTQGHSPPAPSVPPPISWTSLYGVPLGGAQVSSDGRMRRSWPWLGTGVCVCAPGSSEEAGTGSGGGGEGETGEGGRLSRGGVQSQAISSLRSPHKICQRILPGFVFLSWPPQGGQGFLVDLVD